jgi:cellulose synthase/poly-beta-1,6-N-acetylglucosamine synthase-like glycosyltransferase
MLAHVVFPAVSLVMTLSFCLYAFNHYYLLRASRRYVAPRAGGGDSSRPPVAIHLPVYNESYVVRRLVDACARVAEAYGAEQVRIVIIDDSDDDTVQEVDRVVADYAGSRLRVEVLRRGRRQGYKAGALQLALERTPEPYIAVFDADFVPPPGFLSVTIPHFLGDDKLGIVQSRWTHINRQYNFLTRAIAIGIDVHFSIEQTGRFAAGCFLNFNGSAGVFRRAALVAAGGWQTDTLAEDLDASYRIQMGGYRAVYLKSLAIPAEVPPSVPSFKQQQARWACGSLRAAKKLLPALLADRAIPWKKRLQAFIHLTNYLVHPLLLFSFVLACLASIFRADGFGPLLAPVLSPSGGIAAAAVLLNLGWISLVTLICLSTVAGWVYPVAALRAGKLSILRNVPSLFILFFLGCGCSISNTIEAGKALLTRRSWSFHRTPKYALQRDGDAWEDKKYQVPLDFVSLAELAVIGLGLFAMGWAAGHANYGVLPVLAPYTAAFAFVFVLTIKQSRREKGG